MGGAQPLAASLCGATSLNVEVDPHRIERRLETRYLDEVADDLDDAVDRVRRYAADGRGVSIGILGNAADVFAEIAARGIQFDLVTDQTSAHDMLNGYVPSGMTLADALALRASRPRRVRPPGARDGRPARPGDARPEGRREPRLRLRQQPAHRGPRCRPRACLRLSGLRSGLRPAALLPGRGPVPVGGALGRPGRHPSHRRGAARGVPRRRAPPAVAADGARPDRVPGAARSDLLARLRRPRQGGAALQRPRAPRRGLGADRDRPRPPRHRFGRLAVPRDRGDEGRLRRDRRLADPERASLDRVRGVVGVGPPRRRRGDRQLDPRRARRRRRRHRRDGRAARRAC